MISTTLFLYLHYQVTIDLQYYYKQNINITWIIVNSYKMNTQSISAEISLGVGNAVSEFSQLPSSFFEANEAYEDEAEKGEKAFLKVYKSKSVQELLQLIPESKLKPFITYTLGPLAYPIKTKDKELKYTL